MFLEENVLENSFTVPLEVKGLEDRMNCSRKVKRGLNLPKTIFFVEAIGKHCIQLESEHSYNLS